MKKSIIVAGFALLALVTIPFANAFMSPAPTKVQTVNVNDRYSIDLPTYLTKGSDLNFEASLEYQNLAKEVYIIIIDEPTDEFVKVFNEIEEYDTTKSPLDNYVDAQLESIRGNMSKVTSESAQRKIKTQSGEAIVYDVAGFQDGIEDEMGFTVAFMQGKLCLYMVMTWTFQKTKPVYQADMDNMIASFKELSGAVDTFPHFFATEKFSASLPHGFIPDTSACSSDCVGFSKAEGNLLVGFTEFEMTEWKNAYKKWPDRKTYSLLEFFALSQKNYQAKSAPVGTTHTELKTGKTNGRTSCSFSRVEPATEEDESWYYESLIVQGKDRFFYLQFYCPADNAPGNQADIKFICDSFKLR